MCGKSIICQSTGTSFSIPEKPEQKPYTCPVCKGKGWTDDFKKVDIATLKCFPCRGKGIVWQYESEIG